jgi:anti-sigma factor (TIGR02949 family)
MKCCDARQKLYPFLDNALNVQENLDILSHLNICSACSDHFESEKQLESVVKEKFIRKTQAPENLWDSLRPKMERVEKEKTLRQWFRKKMVAWTPALAAGLLITLGLLYYLAAPRKLDAGILVNQSIMLHEQMLKGPQSFQIPIKLKNDFEKTKDYLSRKTGLNVCDHNLSKLGFSPRGGSLAECDHIPGGLMATLAYHRGNNDVSHFILRDPEMVFPESSVRQIEGTGEYYYFVVKPYKVIILRDGPNLCMFVGNLNQNQVSDIVEEALKRINEDTGSN